MNPSKEASDRPGPLAGVRILDLTRVLAGPFCTMVLADLGAEVIKIEGPTAPDYTRSIPPFQGDMSHYFLSVNRNKKSVCLDLKSSAGRRVAQQLAWQCDAVVENFRPGVLERLGLGFAELSEHKPDIIVCSLSGFGQRGSMSRKPSVDTVVQGMSGAMSLTGETDGPPLKLGLPMGDLAGSMWAVVGLLAALRRRDETGVGEHVDVSLLDSLTSYLSYVAQLYLSTGEVPTRIGSNHHTVPAYGRYAAKDGYLVLAAQMDSFWVKFCGAAGRPEVAQDPRYDSVSHRRSHFAEVEALVAEIMATKTVAEWEALLDAADVPHGPLRDVAGALENPHAVERGLLRDIDQPGFGPVRVLGPVLRFLNSEWIPELTPAPALGEHTREVLEQLLDLPHEEVERLLADGSALATGP